MVDTEISEHPPAWRCSQLLSHHPPEGAAGTLGALGAQKSAVLGVPQSVCRKGRQDVSVIHLDTGNSVSPDSYPCCSRCPDSACSAPEDPLPSQFPPCPASHLEGEGLATTQRGDAVGKFCHGMYQLLLNISFSM